MAHELAMAAVEKLNHTVRITIHGHRFSIVETDKTSIHFYAHHITFSEKRGKTYEDSFGFDVEEKIYNTSNDSTKISFYVHVEGELDKDTYKYIEKGRPEKERKRAEEIQAFIDKLMADADLKPEPRFSLAQQAQQTK